MLSKCNLKKYIHKLNKKKWKKVYLYYPKLDKGLKLLKNKVVTVKAAGGVVMDDKERLLLIYRNNKWDLPKGKKNFDEFRKDAAIREVVEETGVKGLVIKKKLMNTYHFFKNNSKYKLKETTWYLMKTSYKGDLTPQLEENIIKAEWKSKDQVRELIHLTYLNVKQLLITQKII